MLTTRHGPGGRLPRDRIRRAVLGALRRFLPANAAVAATEFALVLPVLLLIYAGAGQLSQAVMTSRKVSLLAATLTQLTSQQPTFQQATSTPAPSNPITQVTVQTMLNASAAIMAPSSLTPLKMTISAIDIVNNSAGLCCSFKVRWSYTQAGTLRPCNTALTPVSPSQAPSATTVPSSMIPPVATLTAPLAMLVADVSYTYSGAFSSDWINFASGLSQTSYMVPRTIGQVILTGPISAGAGQSGAICY